MSYSINFGTTYGNVSGSQWSINTNSKPEQYQASAKSLGNLLLYFFNEMLEVIFPNFFFKCDFYPFYGLFVLDLIIIFTIHSKYANFFSF
jgi:hypothetical protein